MSKQETKKKKKNQSPHLKWSRRIRRVDKNKNKKIADTLITGVGVLFVSKIVVQGNIFKLNRWRTKKENGQSYQ